MKDNFTFELNIQDKTAIDTWLAQYPADQKRSALIPALHIVQKANGGWLSEAAMKAVADYLDLPQIQVFEVATFYSMFELAPVGKHIVCVCTNVSCLLSGSDEVVAHFKKRLNIDLGETTVDKQITLREVECLGACVQAPVLRVDEQFHTHLTPEKIDALLAELEKQG